ncbi:hypothetical protein [Streptomyces sp. NPDC050504]|uniref:hypothetical protein n=1 Tax=Streptomyces sp. NPDC050504 TaxID=3365618 RepID=UPI0037AE4BD0
MTGLGGFDEFVDAALGFPAALFGGALVVVIGFWLLVLVGGAEADGEGPDAWGLGGVPLSIGVSLYVATGWFAALAGTVLLHRLDLDGWAGRAAGAGALLGALVVAGAATKLLVRPLKPLFPDEPEPSRADFVGLTCVIRTGRVDEGFGQAEVAARDGSTAIVQVRQAKDDVGSGELALGSAALLYAYDEEGEFFWVAPH